MLPRHLKSEYKLLLREFQAGKKLSPLDAAEFLHIHLRNARAYCNLLHAHHQVYVVRWIKKHQGPAMPVYAYDLLGDAEDAEYPPPLNGAEQKRRQRLAAKFREERNQNEYLTISSKA